MLLLAAIVASLALPPIPRVSEIHSIVIRHDPDHIVRYASWTLGVLHDPRTPGIRITAQPTLRQIAGAFARSSIHLAIGKPRMTDATRYSPKWSFVFVARDAKVVEVSVDASGTTGAIDKLPVTFSSIKPELDRLKRDLPNLEYPERYRYRATSRVSSPGTFDRR